MHRLRDQIDLSPLLQDRLTIQIAVFDNPAKNESVQNISFERIYTAHMTQLSGPFCDFLM